MIRLVYGPVDGKNPYYTFICPHCCGTLNFTVVSPVLCPKCGEELPELDMLDDEIGNRISYHVDV